MTYTHVFFHVTVNRFSSRSHYEEKHGQSINDELILSLVRQLDGQSFRPETQSNEFNYFATNIEYQGKRFKLVWLLEKEQIYVGIINAHRRS